MNATPNRRAAIGGAIVAGATAALQTPAAASSPELSTLDRQILDMWDRLTQLRETYQRINKQLHEADSKLPEWARDSAVYGADRIDPDLVSRKKAEDKRAGLDVLGEQSDAAADAFSDFGLEFEKYLGDSVLALGAVLIMEINFDHIAGLNSAALAAIRPQLVGMIAEDADRALAEYEEACT
jgi:hypothetical protein